MRFVALLVFIVASVFGTTRAAVSFCRAPSPPPPEKAIGKPHDPRPPHEYRFRKGTRIYR